MSEHEKFAVPHEIEEILDRLPPQVTLHVPDDTGLDTIVSRLTR